VKVAMIGLGKLGLPCAEVMAEHYDVCGYDVATVDPTMTVAIVKEINRLVELPDAEFKHIIDQCQHIVDYNRQLFFNSTALKK